MLSQQVSPNRCPLNRVTLFFKQALKIESSKMEIRWKLSIYREKEGESFEKRKAEYEKLSG